MAKKAGGRLISSAGLVNYYESEDRRAVHISPVAVIIAVIAIVGHLMLSSKAKSMVEEIEFNALRLENMLARRGAGETNPLDAESRG